MLYLLTCTLAMSLLFTPELPGQCPPESVVISSKEDLTHFIKSYPDCTRIRGDLIIGTGDGMSSTQIRALKGLECIEYIHGSLKIRNNVWLKSLEPLSNVKSIGGALIVQRNPELIEGFVDPAVKNIGGDLVLTGLMTGGTYPFPHLEYIGGHVDLSAFAGQLNMFPALQEIGGDLKIVHNYNLDRITDFDRLKTIGGHLIIGNNPSLKHIHGFARLIRAKEISLEKMHLESLNMGDQLRFADNITLQHFQCDTPVSAFDHLTRLKMLFLKGIGPEVIRYFKNLEEVTHLNLALLTPEPIDAKHFTKLSVVHGDLVMDASFFPAIRSVRKIGHDWVIRRLNDLGSLSQLHNIDTVGHIVYIEEGDFNDFYGLPQLDISKLCFRNNFKIKDLEGFDLQKLHVRMLSFENNSIRSLKGLVNRPPAPVSIHIIGNIHLSNCCTADICAILDNDLITWEIERNGEQCDVASIRQQCEVRW